MDRRHKLSRRFTARAIPRYAMLSVALLSGCAGPEARRATAPQAAGLPVFHREDMLWLQRISFGIDGASVAELHRLGRERYLDRQLSGPEAPLPPGVAADLGGLEIARTDPLRSLAEVAAQYKAINAMPDGADKEQARKALNEHGNQLAYEAMRRDLLRAVYSTSQLREQMVWFWLNHFSVYQYKANLRWLIGDYEERAIRPHALGQFKDLVLATLEHPAMLQYLDNSQNAAGHVNENYARELMELHTLGVGRRLHAAGRAAARAGPHRRRRQRRRMRRNSSREWQRLYRRSGAFEFNPARHDFGAQDVARAHHSRAADSPRSRTP